MREKSCFETGYQENISRLYSLLPILHTCRRVMIDRALSRYTKYKNAKQYLTHMGISQSYETLQKGISRRKETVDRMNLRYRYDIYCY